MDYRADHVAGALPEVFASLQNCNAEPFATSYGSDETTSAAKQALCSLFGTTPEDCAIAFVSTGTAANCIALSCIAQPFSTILCAKGAHLHTSECNAPEFFSGAKLTLLEQHPDGRIKSESLKELVEGKPHKYPHEPKPSALSITQPTEAGAVYSVQEVRSLCQIAKRNGLKVHMDGARIANAVAKFEDRKALIQFTKEAGVDCISFGTTKNVIFGRAERVVIVGTICCEVVLLFDKELEEELGYRVKRAGQLLEKTRFMSCQLLGYLKDDTWIKAASNANNMAEYFAKGYDSIQGCHLVRSPVTNLVYVEMLRKTFDKLVSVGYKFSLLAGSQDAKGRPSTKAHVRFRICLSWRHTKDDIDRLLQDIAEATQE